MVYSDGYSDNIFSATFVKCIEKLVDPETSFINNFARAADCQARRAYIMGKKTNYMSPFAVGAQASGRVGFNGGKADDISVIMA
jgi:hypothetical protein